MRCVLHCSPTIQFCYKLSSSLSLVLGSEVWAYCVLKGRISNGFYVKIIQLLMKQEKFATDIKWYSLHSGAAMSVSYCVELLL